MANFEWIPLLNVVVFIDDDDDAAVVVFCCKIPAQSEN